MALNYEFENKSKRRISIDDLENGDLFIYDHTLFMLLSNSGGYGYFYIDKEDDKGERCKTIFVAVDLSDGILKEFESCEYVTLVKKDLTIQINEQDLAEWV